MIPYATSPYRSIVHAWVSFTSKGEGDEREIFTEK